MAKLVGLIWYYVYNEFMKLIECEKYYRYPVGDSFVAGFTKPGFMGILPEDILSIFPNSKVAFMDQEHGGKVLSVLEPGKYTCDGIFTSCPELVLVVKTADCLPLIFFSPKNKMSGVVHMGWRSAEKGILGNIEMDLKDFIVIAGTGLRKCCYEVGPEFKGYKDFSDYIVEKNNGFSFDPILFAKNKLIENGLKEENFFDSAICSLCFEYGLPSYRKTKTKSRTLSFILGPRYMSSQV